MPRVSLSDGLAVAGIVFAIVLVVLDKAGKLTGSTLFVLLAVAALMTLPLVLANTWVADAPSDTVRFFRGTAMLCMVGLVYAGLSAWIATGNGQ